MNPKRSGYHYITFYTRNGFIRRLTWCSNCNESRRDDVNKEYDRREKIDIDYMKQKRQKSMVPPEFSQNVSGGQ